MKGPIERKAVPLSIVHASRLQCLCAHARKLEYISLELLSVSFTPSGANQRQRLTGETDSWRWDKDTWKSQAGLVGTRWIMMVIVGLLQDFVKGRDHRAGVGTGHQ